MRHFQSEKYTIAWFKLADFVSRGEKERALSLYRLLMHSIDDEALSHQLAGDLLLSFNDEQALKKYQTAAELYKNKKRFLQAAAVYEQIVSLQSKDKEALHNLIVLYKKLDQKNNVLEVVKRLCSICLVENKPEEILEVLSDGYFTATEKASIHSQFSAHFEQ